MPVHTLDREEGTGGLHPACSSGESTGNLISSIMFGAESYNVDRPRKSLLEREFDLRRAGRAGGCFRSREQVFLPLLGCSGRDDAEEGALRTIGRIIPPPCRCHKISI